MSATVKNNAKIAAICNQRIRALKAHGSAKTVIPIRGVSYKTSDLIGIYQAVLDHQAALVKSRAQVDADLAARNEAETKRESIESGLKSWVLNSLGADSNAASEFGYSAPKKGTKTADVVAAAVKLGKATRKARNTLGKKQKLKIKGALDASTVPAAPAVATPTATGIAPASVAPAQNGGAPSH
jgi:hypothetical protein